MKGCVIHWTHLGMVIKKRKFVKSSNNILDFWGRGGWTQLENKKETLNRGSKSAANIYYLQTCYLKPTKRHKKNRDSLISNSKLPIVLHKVCVPVLITEIRKMFIANHLYIIQQVHSKTHNLWPISAPERFVSAVPSSGSHYNRGVQANLPTYIPLLLIKVIKILKSIIRF